MLRAESFRSADPGQTPELLELYRLVATPAVVQAPPRRSSGVRRQHHPEQLKAGWPLAQREMVSGLGMSCARSVRTMAPAASGTPARNQLLVLRRRMKH